jgi:hypothetical protein
MSVTEIIIKVIGIVLALVGFALLLSAVGVGFLGVGLSPWWVSVIVGLLLLGLGIYIIRGGNITF